MHLARVVHVMASGARGGGADHLIGLLPELRAAGLNCTALVGSDGPLCDALTARAVPTQAMPLMHSRTSLRAVARMAAAIKRSSPQLVHYHGTRAAFFGACAQQARLLPASLPTVYTAHGLSYRKTMSVGRTALFQAVEWWACRHATQVISVSRADLDDLRGRGFVQPQNGWHIPNAVDTHRFAPGDRAAARRALQLPQDAFIVGVTARLVAQKAVGDLLRACQQVSDVTLAIIGDGPERAALTQQAQTLPGRVFFLGSRGDVPACLPAFDVFALASHWEGEPIVLLEAMACALPCIATRTAGACEILEDGALGLLVDVAAPSQLAYAIRKLQAQPHTRAHLAQRGRDAIATRTYQAQAQRVLSVYGALL